MTRNIARRAAGYLLAWLIGILLVIRFPLNVLAAAAAELAVHLVTAGPVPWEWPPWDDLLRRPKW